MITAWSDQRKLDAATRVGKTVQALGRDGTSTLAFGVVEDEVCLVVDGAKYIMQRIRLADGVGWDDSRYAYRFGAFVVDVRTRAIRWTQYTPTMTEREYATLLARAAEKWPAFATPRAA